MLRRQFFAHALAAGISAQFVPVSVSAQEQDFFETLSAEMQSAAQKEPQAPPELPASYADLTYDQYRRISFIERNALWRDTAPFNVHPFAPGWLQNKIVQLFDLSDEQVEPLTFSNQDFEFREPLDSAKFHDIPFPGPAGFKVTYALNRPDRMDELAAFLGASYFRALGQGSYYGISARGIAIDTASGRPEEFPAFTRFYFQTPAPDARSLTFYAALDGPSLTGAYKFVVSPGKETVMDVTARLYFRRDIGRLGIAPLTSMFLYGPQNRTRFDDFRPRVHDSQGMKIVRQSGEEVWRVLNNPVKLAGSFYVEDNPVSFGLLQRARDFDDYLDAEARYEKRPSVMVEPASDWGKGAVSLIEIPSDTEVNDNIVAFWTPEAPAKKGGEAEYSYRLRWGDLAEPTDFLARVVRFSAGHAGVSGQAPIEDARKFVIDFAGTRLGNVPDTSGVEPQISVSRGELINSALERHEDLDLWRLAIDVGASGDEPVEIGAALMAGGTKVTETWTYQWRPADDRN